jgi:4-alpha-glucanotransferase
LGVNTAGYDVWRHRDFFALGASGGAPPDLLCTRGQDWGFAPFHPERIRKAEYRYYIDSLRHHLKHAGRLRLDHVMGLHRLFWVPSGWSATEGAYVHYRADEFYAILSLESHRYQACLVGENLGTVPAYVNAAIFQHAIRATHVGQFNIQPDPNEAYEQPARTVAASLNTHDLPTFAAFWEGLDIDDRFASGLIDEAAACQEREARARLKEALSGYLNKEGWLTSNLSDPEAVLAAWLAFFAAGPAELLLINLEDLWLETNPQNTPGTSRERPNWSRMTRYRFEDYSTDKQVLSILRAINRLRRHPVKS